ncbi:MAG: metabolite traffic protein EboE [Planctomycetota bacterium]|nr:metabolite traffic protein EboE [Planctomycetaceae bacterium]MDQ3331508.1 metabolite traffic protein EboE [Planctomycetota bacterium]
MTLSTLPLCYCTNVHPGRTLAEVESGIDTFAASIATAFDGPLSIGLWFADPVSGEIETTPDAVSRLRDKLESHRLSCHTLNAFPFGDFHSERVKEGVYLPDWSSPQRLDYTLRCCGILAELMPDGREGSVSTLPLGFAAAKKPHSYFEACIAALIDAARRLDELHSETGRIVRLAIEPEPFCHLQTTDEAVAFFERLRDRAEDTGARDIVDQHIGLCYDVCHQAVEFEDAATSIAALRAADVRINKVQISCAIELANPRDNVEGRNALAEYVEPRYLHQTFARNAAGQIVSIPDLTRETCLDPPEAFLDAEAWRVHFHVPVNETRIGPLFTTRPQLEVALAAIEGLDYAPHLEVETYTWAVLPGGDRPSIIDGIAQELRATRRLLADLRLKSP